ncbi:MAG TPA: tRNA (adenosine(37)-N6)-threonylcarbamoyltransferase complex ATPase subunit type 1 TsaE [Candidatus Dependentiae bacterium]|nr:tRNA (adenosine(37)-N6)-threonylcarbamoyltransferase complex ATPase subunit type 1 TsaE [Candidatus Dependentiae bacterium]
MIANKPIIYSLQELKNVVDSIHAQLQTCNVFTFTGPLGVGKTTLIRALLKKCGIEQSITSPTFTYVNIYKDNQGNTFHHFDLYRLNSLHDFVAAGFDEYLYLPNSWSFIEWPEIIMPILTHAVCHIVLDYDDSRRSLTMQIIK